MANGRPGDHPLMDYLLYKKDNLPEEVARLVDKIQEIDPTALYQRTEPDMFAADGTWILDRYREANGDWFAWERGENLDEAVVSLENRLKEARGKQEQEAD
jgi:hypothetical protein